MDSYQDFLSYFGIEKQALFQWGIEKTIFPSPAKAEQEWNMLKYRVLHNQTVYTSEDMGGMDMEPICTRISIDICLATSM